MLEFFCFVFVFCDEFLGSMLEGVEDADFLLNMMVRSEVQVLVGVCLFPEDGGFRGSVR